MNDDLKKILTGKRWHSIKGLIHTIQIIEMITITDKRKVRQDNTYMLLERCGNWGEDNT